MLRSIRARLTALLILAAVPLICLAALVAWQNYDVTLSRARMVALLVREAAVARHRAALDGVEQMLSTVGQARLALGQNTGPACDDFLSGVLDGSRDRYANIALLDVTGDLVCSASPIVRSANRTHFGDQAWFADAVRTRALTIGGLQTSVANDGDPVLVFAQPILKDGAPIGVASASLRIRWLARETMPGPGYGANVATWLVSKRGQLLTGDAAAEANLPAPDVLQSLLERPGGAGEARSRGGRDYAYAVAELSHGLVLLVGYDADIDTAHRVLLTRFLQLALVMLVGLIAVAFGVHSAVVDPLHRLTRAVSRWRAGEAFAPERLGDVPAEIEALSNAFLASTTALAQREGELTRSLEQQELLMQEIHHRVKNNLQVVASLLNLQSSRIRNTQAKAEFQSARDRIRALATLHRHLYIQGDLHMINMRSFLNELCGQIFQAMGEPEGDRIRLFIDASELQLSGDQAVPLALIVTEAVSNALKYAFPAGRSGMISVHLTSDTEVAHLTVADDGVGIPSGRADTEAGVRDGLGIQLIRGFARQLNATLSVEEGDGTRYTLEIPLRTATSLDQVRDVRSRANAPSDKDQPVAGAA